MAFNQSPKPRLLCLHGGGTSSLIFRIQARQLQRMLENDIDFVYLDAPFESPPGPGVLPTFEGAGPFAKWTSRDDNPPADAGPDDFLKIQESIRQLREKGLLFDGIMAFSQGVRVACALLREAQRRFKDGESDDFRFGVFIAGTYPPLQVKHDVSEDLELCEDGQAYIRFPTLHVIGNEDPLRRESLQVLSQICDSESASQISFRGKHEVPSAGMTLERLSSAIRGMMFGGDCR